MLGQRGGLWLAMRSHKTSRYRALPLDRAQKRPWDDKLVGGGKTRASGVGRR
jgi:hypothetical protein